MQFGLRSSKDESELNGEVGVMKLEFFAVSLLRAASPFDFTSNSDSVFGFGQKLIRRNLVDPASSHMLVSKIKPCMSQYQHYHC